MDGADIGTGIHWVDQTCQDHMQAGCVSLKIKIMLMSRQENAFQLAPVPRRGGWVDQSWRGGIEQSETGYTGWGLPQVSQAWREVETQFCFQPNPGTAPTCR